MKLDTVRQTLRDVLAAFEQGKATPLDPNLLEDVIWFLDLLRKREGYDVERPVRRERRDYQRNYENPFSDETAWQQQQRRERVWKSEFEQRFKPGFQDEFAEKAQKIFEEFLKRGFYSSHYEQTQQKPPPPTPPPSDKRSWHEVLEVNPNSSPEIRLAAYRRKAMECHPDRGGTTEQMQELNRARKEAGI